MGVLVVHTTETPAGTAAAVGRNLLRDGKASHEVYDPVGNERVRLVPWGTPSKSLKNLAGGVETNRRGGVYQVEIVGYAAETPTQPDWWYQRLGSYLSTVCDETGVPKVFPCQFVAGGYGVNAPQRLTHEAWLSVEGIIGHQHVPENDHWDPGGLDVARLGIGDNDMTPEQAQQLNDIHFALVGARRFQGDQRQHDLATPILSTNYSVQTSLTVNGQPVSLNGMHEALASAMPTALDVEQLAEAIVRRIPQQTGGSVMTGPSLEQVKQALREVLKDGVG